MPRLHEVPSHWSEKQLRFVTDLRLSNVDKKSVEGQEAVRLCNYTDVYYNERISAVMSFMEATATQDQIRRFSLQPGDVLLTKDSETADDIAVPSVVTDELPGVLCGYHLAVARPSTGIFGPFLARALAVSPIRDQLFSAANGVTRFGLGRSDIGIAVVPVPPESEQRAIAAFLDRETARIDALITKRRRLIELFQEERAAVITRATTCGINQDAEYVECGVPWLARIPKGWGVMSLARLTTKLTNGYVGPTRDLFVDEGVPYLQSLHIKRNRIKFGDDYFVTPEWSRAHAKSILREGDVLVVQTGDIGQVAHVPKEWAGANCHALIVCSPNPQYIEGQYLAWLLTSKFGEASLLSCQTGALHPHLNCGVIKHMLLPVPPLAEQRAIVNHVTHVVDRIRELETKTEKAIALLSERRAALISAAVTGQIDVREAA